MVSEVVIDVLGDRYDTTRAETAAEGVERLRAGGVDLILLDCTLPGGLGEALLPTADSGRVPVILMSGNPAMAEQVPGSRPLVLKPFSLAGLLETVQGVLGR
ncbi:MAG: hypothetical protein JOY66_14975 [Acetobacteraceae bacterium]|nr:hypothetical protein [Acetobacteraceae bacterium]